MSQDKFWKLIYFGVERSKIKATSHRNIADVGLCTLVNAGCLQFRQRRIYECGAFPDPCSFGAGVPTLNSVMFSCPLFRDALPRVSYKYYGNVGP